MTSTHRAVLAPANRSTGSGGATVLRNVGFAPANRLSKRVVAVLGVAARFVRRRVDLDHGRTCWRDGDVRRRLRANKRVDGIWRRDGDARRVSEGFGSISSTLGFAGAMATRQVGFAPANKSTGSGGAMVARQVGFAPANRSTGSGGAMVTRDVGIAPASRGWGDE